MRLPRTSNREKRRELIAGMVEWQTQWIQNPPSNIVRVQVPLPAPYARVVELADTLDLGSSAVRCAGSSPVTGTILRGSSSWLARQPHKLEVVGSSPPPATNRKRDNSRESQTSIPETSFFCGQQ